MATVLRAVYFALGASLGFAARFLLTRLNAGSRSRLQLYALLTSSLVAGGCAGLLVRITASDDAVSIDSALFGMLGAIAVLSAYATELATIRAGETRALHPARVCAYCIAAVVAGFAAVFGATLLF